MVFQGTTKHENNLISGSNPPLPPFTKGGSGGILPLKPIFVPNIYDVHALFKLTTVLIIAAF